MSVFWELDSEYNVVNTWFGRTIIRSAYKVHYFRQQLGQSADLVLFVAPL